MEYFLGVTVPKVGRCSFYTRKEFQLWMVQQPEPQAEVCLNI